MLNLVLEERLYYDARSEKQQIVFHVKVSAILVQF